MPKRGKPEAPLLNYGNYGMGGLLGDTGILEWDTAEEYHLSWQLPEDNGLPIDMFLLQYYPVSSFSNFINFKYFYRLAKLFEQTCITKVIKKV